MNTKAYNKKHNKNITVVYYKENITLLYSLFKISFITCTFISLVGCGSKQEAPVDIYAIHTSPPKQISSRSMNANKNVQPPYMQENETSAIGVLPPQNSRYADEYSGENSIGIQYPVNQNNKARTRTIKTNTGVVQQRNIQQARTMPQTYRTQNTTNVQRTYTSKIPQTNTTKTITKDRTVFHEEVVKGSDGILYKNGERIPYSGIVIRKYPSGRTYSRTRVGDGRFVDDYTEYFETGAVKVKGEYRNGIQDGTWITNHSTGAVALKGEFIRGQLAGTWYVYNAEGFLAQKKIYKDGKLVQTIPFTNTSGNKEHTTRTITRERREIIEVDSNGREIVRPQ